MLKLQIKVVVILHCLRYQLHLVVLVADIFPSDTRIGQILETKVLDHGFNYQIIPTVNVPTNMQIEDASDSFTVW